MYTENNNFARCRLNDRCAQRGGFEPFRESRREETPSNNGCDISSAWGLVGYPLASVYAPLQEWRELYDEDRALKSGTLFAQLDLPFVCGKNGKGGCGCD